MISFQVDQHPPTSQDASKSRTPSPSQTNQAKRLGSGGGHADKKDPKIKGFRPPYSAAQQKAPAKEERTPRADKVSPKKDQARSSEASVPRSDLECTDEDKIKSKRTDKERADVADYGCENVPMTEEISDDKASNTSMAASDARTVTETTPVDVDSDP